MLETAEIMLVTMSAILISLSFWYCLNLNSQAGKVDRMNNNQESLVESAARRRKKKSENRRGSVSISSSRRSSMSVTGMGGMGVQQDQTVVMQTRLVEAEKEVVEMKMRNLKLLKMTENLGEKNRAQDVQIEQLEELQVSYYLLKSKDDQSKERIVEMENKIVALEEGSKFVGEEKQKLEKMLAEQQKIIKLALARILPRKGEVAFCQEHVGTIRQYENKYFY